MGLGVNILRTRRVFRGRAVWNFRYFRMERSSDLYCMLIAEFGSGKGEPHSPFANHFYRERASVVDLLRSETLYRQRSQIAEFRTPGSKSDVDSANFDAVEETRDRWRLSVLVSATRSSGGSPYAAKSTRPQQPRGVPFSFIDL